MFNCPLCTKTFRYSYILDNHVVTHTKEKPHKCSICSGTFGHESSLKKHINVVHAGIKQSSNKNHHCEICSYKCSAKSVLQNHVRKHSAELPFSCHRPGCGFRTKYKYSLTPHGRQVHSDKRPFKCPSDGCSYKAKKRGTIRRHLRVHSNDKPFSCTVPECNYSCKFKSNLESHISRAHSVEKPFKCSVCDFRTKFSNDLRAHDLTHTGIKRFQCQAPNCGYASIHGSNLKEHFDRKHRTKEVLCTEPKCNFRCGSIALLKKHLKRHKLPILKCPSDSCCFSSRYKQNLLKHISRQHNDFQPSVMVAGTSMSDLKTAGTMDTMQCSFTDCSSQLKSRQHYDRKIVTRTKEETGPHVCAFCCSRFSKLSLLKAHVKKHIREKPYSCSHCSYSTSNSSRLKRHARKIHQIQIHVIPTGKHDQVRKCRTCGRNSLSHGESVLHSMSHLQPIVVLEQLKLHIL